MTLRTLLDRFDLLMDTHESVAKLRQFILRLAVSGRLTDQKPDDTHAEVLLEQVMKEKQRLYDRGDIRKPKSFEPLEEEQQPFPIPQTWKWTRIGEIRRGWGRKEPDEPFPYLDVSSINKEDGEISDEYEIVPPGEAPSRARKRVSPGTVLYSSVRPYLLNIAIVDDRFDLEPIASTAFIIVHPLGKIDEKYVYYYLRSAPMVEYVEDQMAGMAYPAISKSKFLPAPFPLPPPEEQQRIVETVDRLMDECDALEQQQERERTLQVQVGTAATEALQSADNAESLRPEWERVHEHFETVTATPEGVDALRQTILQLAVQGRLTERDPDDTPADVLLKQIQQEKQRLYDSGEWRRPRADINPVEEKDTPHDLPTNWKWISFGQVFDYKGGNQPPKSEFTNEPADGYVRLYQIRDLGNEGDDPVPTYVPEESVSNYMTNSDILIGRYGASVGKVLRGEKGTYNVALVKLQYPKEFVEPDYVYYLLQSRYFQDTVTELSRSAQAGFNKKNLFPIPLPLPPIEEQHRVVEKINQILPLCDDLDNFLSESEERGEQLLEAALRDASMDRQDADAVGANS